jgi:hypothetical protein
VTERRVVRQAAVSTCDDTTLRSRSLLVDSHQRRANKECLTIAAAFAKKIGAKAKKFLHPLPNALMSRSPNFARACGRVPVGGHPDKRPDSRPE